MREYDSMLLMYSLHDNPLALSPEVQVSLHLPLNSYLSAFLSIRAIGFSFLCNPRRRLLGSLSLVSPVLRTTVWLHGGVVRGASPSPSCGSLLKTLDQCHSLER